MVQSLNFCIIFAFTTKIQIQDEIIFWFTLLKELGTLYFSFNIREMKSLGFKPFIGKAKAILDWSIVKGGPGELM